MSRLVFMVLALLGFGALRCPVEHALQREHQRLGMQTVDFNLGLREQLGQLGFLAALSGFRAVLADMLFIQAHVAWERTDWSRVLALFRQVTTLQPRSVLFWDMAAWHMGWNASAAALNDSSQPLLALRVRRQREYLALAKDFLERGIRNNPEKPQLYEALGRLYRDKYQDHLRASECFALAAQQSGAPGYVRRFAAYELSYSEGFEREAHAQLRALYDSGEQERLPTLIKRLKAMEEKLNLPPEERIPDTPPR